VAFEPYILPPLDEEGQAPVQEPPPEQVAISDFEQSAQDLPPEAPVQPEARPPLDPDIQAAMEAHFGPQIPEPQAANLALPANFETPPPQSALDEAFAPQSPAPPVPQTPSPQAVPEEEADPVEKERERLAGLSSVDLAEEAAKKQLAYDAEFGRRRAEEEDKLAASQADAATTFKNAVAQTQSDMTALRARADEYANRKPEGFFSGEWDAGKVVGLIKAIAIGLISPMHGLLALNGEFDKDLAKQKAEIQTGFASLGKQASILGDELALHGDLYKAEQAVNLAWKQRLPSMLAAEMAQFDPAGSTAMKLEMTRRQALADAAKAHAEVEKETLDNNLKAAQIVSAVGNEQRAQAKFKKEMAPKSAGPKMSPEYIKQVYGIDVPGPMSEKELKNLVGLKKDIKDLAPNEKEQLDIQKGRADVTVAEEAAKTATTASEILDPVTNKPVGRAGGGPEAAKEANQVGHYYVRYRNTMAKIADIISGKNTQYGGPGSERWQTVGKTKVNTLRQDAANQLAKLRDPNSVNKKDEVDQALKEIPDFNGWAEEKNPIDLYKIRVEQADDEYNFYLRSKIPGFDEGKSPALHFQGNDATILSPSVKPAEGEPSESILAPTVNPFGIPGANIPGAEADLAEAQDNPFGVPGAGEAVRRLRATEKK